MVSELRHAASCAALTCLLLAAPAAAQDDEASSPTGEPSAADVESARNLMDIGRQKYDEGDYPAALKAFQGADAIMQVTSTGLWVGKALMKVGRLVEARDKLYAVSKIPAQPNETDIIANAREEAEKLQFEIADRIPQMQLAIEGVPKGAPVSVKIDGDDVPAAALQLPRKVDPGAHVVVATCPGFQSVEMKVEVAEGGTQTVTLRFEAAADGGDPAPVTTTPPETVSDEGMSPLFWAGVGVAGLGVVAGSITGGLSLAAASEAKDGCDGKGKTAPPTTRVPPTAR